MRERVKVPLSSMTSLQLGGVAARVVEPESLEELASCFALFADEPVVILGGGSNVIVSDEGWPGTVIHPVNKGIAVRSHGTSDVLVTVGAGEVWEDLVARCVAEGWSGLEALAGIPGLVGASPIQNIGAYGQEVASSIVEVHAFDRQACCWKRFAHSDCSFGYRSSSFRGGTRFLVGEVTFRLQRTHASQPVRYLELAKSLGIEVGDSAQLARVRDAVLALRKSKSMIVDPLDPESTSAGSFYLNPVMCPDDFDRLVQRLRSAGKLAADEAIPSYAFGKEVKIPAAWLIERSGFPKGTAMGRVAISKKHALALVNHGGTTRELLALDQAVRDAVFALSGLSLEREPILLG